MTQRTAASGSRIDGIGLMIGSIHSSITRQHRLGTKWPSMHAVYGDPQVFGWLCRPIAVRRWGSDRDKLPRSLGRVAEWQTRWLQVPVSFGTWGFKSPFAHKECGLGSPTTKAGDPMGFPAFSPLAGF